MPTEKEAEELRRLRALVEGTHILKTLSLEKILKSLNEMVMSPTEDERAILNIFYRMQAWAESLVILGADPKHVQAMGAASRSLFELLLEMKIMNAKPELSARYFAYPEIQKLALANKFKAFLEANKQEAKEHLWPKIKSLTENAALRAQLEKRAQTLWGKPLNDVDSWWEKNIYVRAKAMGLVYERRYRTAYAHE